MTRYTPLWEQAGSYPATLDRRLLGFMTGNTAEVRGCQVTASTAMNVNVAPGQCLIPTANNTGSVLCVSDAVEVVTLATAPTTGQNRYDIIICQARGNDIDGGTNNDFIFDKVTGVAAASNPAIPATPANATVLAQILVGGGSASVVAANIAERRLLAPDLISAYAYVNATYAHTNGQLVRFNATRWNNPPSFFNTANLWFWPPRPGYYLVTGAIDSPGSPAPAWAISKLNRNGDGPDMQLAWHYNPMGANWNNPQSFAAMTYVSGYDKSIGITAITSGAANIGGDATGGVSHVQCQFLHP